MSAVTALIGAGRHLRHRIRHHRRSRAHCPESDHSSRLQGAAEGIAVRRLLLLIKFLAATDDIALSRGLGYRDRPMVILRWGWVRTLPRRRKPTFDRGWD